MELLISLSLSLSLSLYIYIYIYIYIYTHRHTHTHTHTYIMFIDCVLVTQSCLTLCDPCTIAHQAPLSMELSRKEYWSGLSFPS